jgi:hypothetical protein
MIKQYSIYKKLVLENKQSEKLIFENKHIGIYYVYRIFDKEDKTYYYGSRVSKKEIIKDDFWDYCTSGLKKQLIIKHKEKRFKLKILKVFDNPGDMIIYESFLHQFFDVKNHNKFWNKSNQTPWGFSTAGLKFSNPNKGLTYEQILGKKAGEIARNNKKGHKNPTAKNIKLYDNNNELICEFNCINYFYDYCRENSMPSRFYDKRKKERKQIFTLSKNTSFKFRKFEGWYVLIV